MSIFKSLFTKLKGSDEGALGLDSIVGEKCTVIERIDNFAGCGQVKIGSQGWSARGVYDDDTFEVGETLMVVAIEGVKLICKK